MAEFASPGRMQRMVPESLCLRLHLSFPCAEAVRHIPQLTRRLTDVVRAQALGFTGIPTNALIEATTLPHAYVGFDNQRLETLGDAFLKLGVSVYAFNAFPFKHEGQLTNVRIPSVSNRCLLARARAFGLHRFLSGEVGSQKKWSPCLGDGRVDMPRRSMQECVEALLGAAFATGGVPTALAVGERLGLCFGPADQSWTARYGHPSPGPRRLLLRQVRPTHLLCCSLPLSQFSASIRPRLPVYQRNATPRSHHSPHNAVLRDAKLRALGVSRRRSVPIPSPPCHA